MREIDKKLCEACEQFDVEQVALLLEDGADANCLISGSLLPSFGHHYGTGKSPVHIVLFFCDRVADTSKIIQILELLHLQGCDLDARDREQWTPLTFTLRRGNDELTKWLLIHGATEYLTTIHRGTRRDMENMTKKFEELKAEIEQEKEGEPDFDCLMVEI